MVILCLDDNRNLNVPTTYLLDSNLYLYAKVSYLISLLEAWQQQFFFGVCFPGQDSMRQCPQRSVCHGHYGVRQHADAAECQPKDERQGSSYICLLVKAEVSAV